MDIYEFILKIAYVLQVVLTCFSTALFMASVVLWVAGV